MGKRPQATGDRRQSLPLFLLPLTINLKPHLPACRFFRIENCCEGQSKESGSHLMTESVAV